MLGAFVICHDFPCLKSIEIVILLLYYTILYDFDVLRYRLGITFQSFTILIRIHEKDSIPEMRE